MNRQAFTPEEVEKGLVNKFLKNLLELSDELEDSHLDIHITTDGFCTIVEWVDVSFKDESDRFVLLNSDEVIMKEVHFPDNHYEYLFAEEVEERLEEWHKEHPEWVLTPYGIWTNEEENRKFREEFETKDTHDWVVPPYEKDENGNLVEIEEESSSNEETLMNERDLERELDLKNDEDHLQDLIEEDAKKMQK